MKLIEHALDRALGSDGCDRATAIELLQLPDSALPELFSAASQVRDELRGRRVLLCAIVNAKSGRCGQDCAFCAQSAHHLTQIELYDLLDIESVLDVARAAHGQGASCFGIVTSGLGPNSEELERIALMVAGVKRIGLEPCVSLGLLDGQQLALLAAAGLERVHHNLECAQSFYPQICTTRKWADNLAAIRAARDAGLAVCSGGIFGMGEDFAQRVDLALALRRTGIDRVPLNFLHPIPGTPLAGSQRLTSGECLRIVAVYRLLLPHAGLQICGGREHNLGAQQSALFNAGADGLMIGNYLTTSGADPHSDLELIASAGLEPLR
ncbi:MAG: biotin synthase BioB [Candidatus Alcyoniella australis]|nr:biotin synthase BioB [Candidatus Alcyoniella australis]